MRRLNLRSLQRAGLWLSLLAAIIPAVTPDSSVIPDYSEIQTASRIFTGRSLDDFFKYLGHVRPVAQKLNAGTQRTLSKRVREIAMATGQITESRIEDYQRCFTPIFTLHQREGHIILIIFPDQEPSVTIHNNRVIAISTRSVELAESEAGLAGIIAHEVAHEYLTSPRLTSLLDQDARLDHEIELVCDGIAVASLLRLGMDPQAYARSLSAQVRNQKNTSNDRLSLHPALATRLAMIRSVSAWFSPPARSETVADFLSNHEQGEP